MAFTKTLSQLYGKRHHLRHPIPYPMSIQPIGKTLSREEWDKFYTHSLIPKIRQSCVRKIDGDIYFLGEGGLEALVSFQKKFKNRFHLRMVCEDKEKAVEWIKLAENWDVVVRELHYKTDHKEVMLNDQNTIRELMQGAAR